MFSSRTNWPLEPNRFAQAIERHRRTGKPLLDLTASNPTACGFAYPEADILTALADPRAMRYAPEAKGLREAREAVADYYRGRPALLAGDLAGVTNAVDSERILLTSSTSEAYTHIFRLLCEVGGEILVPAPSYPLFEFLADLSDVRLVPYTLLYDHGWQIDFSSLHAALTAHSRAVLVVHPNNPTGSFVKPREAAELAKICAECGMAIVADEVFLDYADGPAPASTFASPSAALTFTLSGLSKISALPQMKLAWIILTGPASLVATAMERLEVITDTYLSPGAPVQLAAPKLLALRGALQSQLRERVSSNLAFLDGVLPSSGPIRRLQREGGWYAVLRVPTPSFPNVAPDNTDESLAVALIEHCSVLVHPGHFFNFATDGFIVLSLIAPAAEFQEAVCRLQRFVGR